MDPTFPIRTGSYLLFVSDHGLPGHSLKKKQRALQSEPALTVYPRKQGLQAGTGAVFCVPHLTGVAVFLCDLKTAGIQKWEFFWCLLSSKGTNVFLKITEKKS